MKTFDELLQMTDEARKQYLREEVEQVINAAPDHYVLKLRHLQSRLDGIRARIKNPQVRLEMIYSEMIDSLNQLNNVFKGLHHEK